MARRTKADKEMENMIALMILIPITILKGIGLIIIFIAKLIGAIVKKGNEQKYYKDLLNIEVQEQLPQIDSLEGIQFEKYIGELLKKVGFYNVTVTKGSGDFGADIIAQKGGEKFAFQCKRFSSSIGPKPI